MPHALLLSPDDQAVTAITDVLQEMSVTCERPLDGVSAAQKLNSQSFDLVLVDCENLAAAKLIFDVCRRGKNGRNPVPIAIVDGRAGLPTAFRLGAELILTKPVAKDQARSTIRTAVSRVRTSVAATENAPAPSASTPASTTATASTGVATNEEHAMAAAAGMGNSPVSGSVSIADSTSSLSAPGLTTTMKSAVDETGASSPDTGFKPSSFSSSSMSELRSEPRSTPTVPANSKFSRPLVPSDDPVLAALDRVEQEESEHAESQTAESQKMESQKPESQKQNSDTGKAAPEKKPSRSAMPAPSSQSQQRKSAGPLALLMLLLAGGGFYAAYTYQPEFRAIAQPQVERLLTLVGMALPPTPAPAPSTQPNNGASKASPLYPAPSAATTPATGATVPAQPSPASGTTFTLPASGIATDAPAANKTETGKTGDNKSDNKSIEIKPADTKSGDPKNETKPETKSDTKSETKNEAKTDSAAAPSSAPLPGENSAVILSSKAAENRLAQSVPPKFPAAAHSEGTVILKAIVDEYGKVEGLRLVEGNALLATAATQAVKQWRYRPYIRDGKAQSFQTVVIVDVQRP